MKKKFWIVLFTIVVLQTNAVYCQKLDSTFVANKIETDTNSTNKKIADSLLNTYAAKKTKIAELHFNTKTPIPKRAAFYSALLPGLGQAYNKQYWKIPIVYAGVAVSSYLFATTSINYQKYRQAFIARTDNNPNSTDNYPQYTATNLRELERENRQLLDRIVVYSALYYGVNIIDALVSSHLKNFDMGKSISLAPYPAILQNLVGVGVKISWQ